MSKILKTHPKSVQAHKDLILQCLDDKDESIRLRALDLLYGMVSILTVVIVVIVVVVVVAVVVVSIRLRALDLLKVLCSICCCITTSIVARSIQDLYRPACCVGLCLTGLDPL